MRISELPEMSKMNQQITPVKVFFGTMAVMVNKICLRRLEACSHLFESGHILATITAATFSRSTFL